MKIDVGIIGLGNMGSFHYRIYKQINEIGNIFLVDQDRQKTANFQEQSFSDYHDLLGKVSLVSIATPTCTHQTIASFFLKHRIPVLIEKPLAANSHQAHQLLVLSKKFKTLIVAGHVERYNAAYLAIKKIIRKPRFIECHRLSPYPNRSLDVSVVLDLMIHDLDIILDIVRDDIKKIEATGIKVLSCHEDIANVRITFKGGCIANVTASRISKERVRKFRVFFPNHYISLDYANQNAEIYKKKGNQIDSRFLPIDKEQPLKKEIEDFVTMVQTKQFTLSSALSAKRALDLALTIQKKINNQ
jgi:predicted dehydrogenase